LSSHDLKVELRLDGDGLLANFDAERAALVLIDKHVPGISVSEIRTRLRHFGVAVPVLLIDAGTTVELPSGATEVDESEPPQRLLEADQLGGAALGARTRMVGRPVSASASEPEAFPTLRVLRDRFNRLTARERQVAQLVAQGHSSKELARKLNLSKNTVDNHRAHILEKLQLANSVQLSRSLVMLLGQA
jgi:FixJ family two-component response regulator